MATQRTSLNGLSGNSWINYWKYIGFDSSKIQFLYVLLDTGKSIIDLRVPLSCTIYKSMPLVFT